MSPEMIELHKAAIHPDIPIVIEGCHIRLFVSVSLSGEYARKHVVCSHPSHVDCNKSRSLTLCKSFGQMEVVAFLGCWIKGASTYANREDHMGWKPSLKEVKGYLKSMRWEKKCNISVLRSAVAYVSSFGQSIVYLSCHRFVCYMSEYFRDIQYAYAELLSVMIKFMILHMFCTFIWQTSFKMIVVNTNIMVCFSWHLFKFAS